MSSRSNGDAMCVEQLLIWDVMCVEQKIPLESGYADSRGAYYSMEIM